MIIGQHKSIISLEGVIRLSLQRVEIIYTLIGLSSIRQLGLSKLVYYCNWLIKKLSAKLTNLSQTSQVRRHLDSRLHLRQKLRIPCLANVR